MQRLTLFLLCILSVRAGQAEDADAMQIRRQIKSTPMTHKVTLSNDQWLKVLAPGQFQALREAKTEARYKNQYWNNHEKGIYRCAACGNELLSSETKFESHTEWPSVYAPLAKDKFTEATDTSYGVTGEEVRSPRRGPV